MNNFIVLHKYNHRLCKNEELIINPNYIVEIETVYNEEGKPRTTVHYESGSTIVNESVEEIKKMLIKNDSNID